MTDQALADELVGTIRRWVADVVIPKASEFEHADEYPEAWVEQMKAFGLFGARIPEEHGGLGLDTYTYARLMEELAYGWMSLSGVLNTHTICANLIYRFGTDDQKARFLPSMATGERRAAFSLSEPDAGSDTQAIRCKAVPDGDEYIVNGTKIWTSSAHLAKWGLFLVRTDPGAIARGEKHVGITALIIDMELPGVQVNPIREITGDAMFCEVLFTDARVPAKYLLGGDGDGWNVAMGTLTHERAGTGSIAIGLRSELDNMIAAAREHNPDALEDSGIRDRIARMYTQVELTRLLNARALSKTLKGERTFPENQIAKLQWSSLSQALAELNIDILGPLGLLEKGGPDAIEGGHAAHNYPWQRFTSIGAGATEVQKNIIADRAIHLPRK